MVINNQMQYTTPDVEIYEATIVDNHGRQFQDRVIASSEQEAQQKFEQKHNNGQVKTIEIVYTVWLAVVQWIEQNTPKVKTQVRFLSAGPLDFVYDRHKNNFRKKLVFCLTP